jgi:hypothetical protein
VDGIDVIAGIIKQVAGFSLFGRKMRRNEAEIAGVETPQQVVVGPVETVGWLFV